MGPCVPPDVRRLRSASGSRITICRSQIRPDPGRVSRLHGSAKDRNSARDGYACSHLRLSTRTRASCPRAPSPTRATRHAHGAVTCDVITTVQSSNERIRYETIDPTKLRMPIIGITLSLRRQAKFKTLEFYFMEDHRTVHNRSVHPLLTGTTPLKMSKYGTPSMNGSFIRCATNHQALHKQGYSAFRLECRSRSAHRARSHAHHRGQYQYQCNVLPCHNATRRVRRVARACRAPRLLYCRTHTALRATLRYRVDRAGAPLTHSRSGAGLHTTSTKVQGGWTQQLHMIKCLEAGSTSDGFTWLHSLT